MKTLFLWAWITLTVGSLALMSFVAPLAYLWTMGMIGITGTMFATGVGMAAMFTDGGFLGFIFAGDLLKCGPRSSGPS